MRWLASISGLLLTVTVVSAADDTPGASGKGQAAGPPASGQAPGSGAYGVSGAHSFRTYCASCHGTDGKGEGPLADSLRFRPPDLTLISKRNGGEFPSDKVHRIVDGRRPLPGHGGPDMPIWGDAFKNPETGFDDEKVRDKVRSVVDHLRTLQAPAK